MEMQLNPTGIAVYTRSEEDETRDQFRWFCETGLTLDLKKLHLALLVNETTKPTPFILIDQVDRLGLIVANLETSRYIRNPRTRIDDTLLLEFGAQDRPTIYRLTAGLLAPDPLAVQQKLMDYAESRFREKHGNGQVTVAPLFVPEVAPTPGSADLLLKCVGLRSNERNQKRVAELLHHLANRSDQVVGPFAVVSTGFVGKDKLREHFGDWPRFIALTCASSIPDDEDVAIEKKKSKPIAIFLAAGAVGFLVLAGCLVLWNKLSK